MDKKRHHDNMLDDKQQLFFGSLSEIARALGNSLNNPISISLLCLEFGIKNDEKEKLWMAFNQIVRDNEYDQLSVPLFRKAMENAIPIEDIMPKKKLSDLIVTAFIKAFARNLIASLEPFARSL